jgi:cell division protein FtsL
VFWRALLFLTLAVAAFGATLRLYLKDGTYQMAREYQVLQDRVRYFSTERGEWEEIPLDLIDLDRTKKDAAENEETLKADAKAQADEDAAERAEQKSVERIPLGPGVYYIHGDKLEPMRAAESKMVNDKKRSVLKVLSPLPIVPGKSTIELDGQSAALRITEKRPEFYFRLSSEERFGIIKLGSKKGVRVVENVEKLPVSEEIVEKQDQVDTFKKQVDDLLFKIWPEKDLEPGEYALIEFTEGKADPQVWDFGVGSGK